RLTAAVRSKIVLHEGLDASGLLEHLDAWGDCFPERAELARVATEAAQSIVHGLGATFPAVISACALSRFALPFQRAWLSSRSHWTALLGTMRAIHLATLAGAARSRSTSRRHARCPRSPSSASEPRTSFRSSCTTRSTRACSTCVPIRGC